MNEMKRAKVCIISYWTLFIIVPTLIVSFFGTWKDPRIGWTVPTFVTLLLIGEHGIRLWAKIWRFDRPRRPTIGQYIFAHNIPLKVWLGFSTIGGLVAVIVVCEPNRALIMDFRGLLWFFLAIVIGPVLGFFLGVFLGSIILPPFYEIREQLNGGPFKPGDHVRILFGRHAGEVVVVDSPWQGRSYRLNLDEESRKEYRDIFDATDLQRERTKEPEPTSPGDVSNRVAPEK